MRRRGSQIIEYQIHYEIVETIRRSVRNMKEWRQNEKESET